MKKITVNSFNETQVTLTGSKQERTQIAEEAAACKKGGCPSYVHCHLGMASNFRGRSMTFPVCSQSLLRDGDKAGVWPKPQEVCPS